MARYTMDAVLSAENNASSEITSLSADLGLLSAQLDSIDGRTININTNFDSGATLTELAAVNTAVSALDGRDVDVKVDVDSAGAVANAATASAALTALSISAEVVGRGVSAAARAIPGLGGALSGLGNVAVTAGVQLAKLGPAGLAAGAALAGLAATAGVAVLAAIGAVAAAIGPLVAGLLIATTAAAGLAAGLALIGGPIVLLVQEIVKYNESLKESATAQKAVETAAKGLRSAEERLGDARGRLDDATRNLNREQRNLNAALRDEPLNQREATLDLADARDRLGDTTRAYNQAVRQYGRNSEEATDALRDMRRAEIDLTRQERETTETRRRGSQELRSAREQFNAASRERTGAARGVRQAELGVAEATRELAKATREARTATVSLSGPALMLNRAWERLKSSVPDQLMRRAKQEAALLGAEVLDLAGGALPRLLVTSQRSSRAMRQGFRQVRNELGPNERNSLVGILDRIPGMLNTGTVAAGKFGGGVVNMLAEASPYAQRFLNSIEGSADAFLRWTRSEQGRRRINQFLTSAAPVAESLGRFLKETGGALFDLGIKHGPTAARAIEFMTDVVVTFINALQVALDLAVKLINAFQWLNRAGAGPRRDGGSGPGYRHPGGYVGMANGGDIPGVPLYRAAQGMTSHYVEDPTLMSLGNANVLYGEALTPGYREYAFADGGNTRFITEDPSHDANSFNLWRELGERKGYIAGPDMERIVKSLQRKGTGTQTRRRPPERPALIRVELDGKVMKEYVTTVVWENFESGAGATDEEWGM